MNPDLLSAYASMAFIGVLALALLAHLSQIAGPNRLLHLVYAATAAGLIYLFGSAAFGWKFVPREIWLGIYAFLFVVVAAIAAIRHARNGDAGFVWGPLLFQQLAMAYVWAPMHYWKPPLSALLLLYFLLELWGWVKGREEIVDAAKEDSHRPPLFPPKRTRGLSEFALAGVAAALVYVFAAGTGTVPVPPTPTEETASAEGTPDHPETEAAAQTATTEPRDAATAEAAVKEPEAPAKAAEPSAKPAPAAESSYTALAGDTLKSIAKKVYGKADKWRAIAAANPDIKPGGKLRKGQVVKLPEPPKL
jgi:LysM repeat protein